MTNGYVAVACQGECVGPQYLSETQYDRQLEKMNGPTNEFRCPQCGDLATVIEEEATMRDT